MANTLDQYFLFISTPNHNITTHQTKSKVLQELPSNKGLFGDHRMKHEQIYNRSLPLLAAALSDQRNIKVEIGGSEAFTNGHTIHLPALPLDANEELLGVARGYIDHESAHVLFTDFGELWAANMTPLQRHLENTIEDIRIEKLMVERFPGCAANLRDTARHVFMAEADTEDTTDTMTTILNSILLEMRTETLPELRTSATKCWLELEKMYPGMPDKLRVILASAKWDCADTAASIEYSRQLIEVLQEFADEEQKSEEGNGTDEADGDGADKADNAAGNAGTAETDSNTALTATTALTTTTTQRQQDDNLDEKPLTKMLAASEDELPTEFGSRLAEELTAQADTSFAAITSTQEVPANFPPMPEEMFQQTQKLMSDLRPRLQGLLQAHTYEGRSRSYQGALNTRRLYEAQLGNGKVFTRCTAKQLTSTAMHVLLDRSGSTEGIIRQATASAYALVHAVQAIRGVNAGLTTFPVESEELNDGISTLVEHGKKGTKYCEINSYGSTPLAEAIWHVLPKLLKQREPRKILVVFTDGLPDNYSKAKRAIADANALGVEIYAVSYQCQLARDLFDNCAVIEDIDELPQAFFEMTSKLLRRAA